jgi:hypothetical protein
MTNPFKYNGRRVFSRILTVLIAALTGPGCQPSPPTKAMHELRVQAEEGVTLHGVEVKFGHQTIPFGVTNHFGNVWFPVRYEPSADFAMDILWWEESEDDKYSESITIPGPTEAERSRFERVVLIYTREDGWTGKIELKDAK